MNDADNLLKKGNPKIQRAVEAVTEAVSLGGGTSRIDLIQDDDSAVVITMSGGDSEPIIEAHGPDQFDGSPQYTPPVDPDYEPPTEYEVAILEDEQ